MTDNKSIDGLSTRAAKTKAEVSDEKKSKKGKKSVKTVSPEDFATAPDTNIWDSIIEKDEEKNRKRN